MKQPCCVDKSCLSSMEIYGKISTSKGRSIQKGYSVFFACKIPLCIVSGMRMAYMECPDGEGKSFGRILQCV